MESWWYDRGSIARAAGAAFISLCIIAVAIGLTKWWFPRLQPGGYGTRSAKAWMALWVFLWLAARTPAASFAILLVWDTFGLLTFRVEQIVEGLLAGIAVAAFGHGVARGLFAPERPERRLVQEDGTPGERASPHRPTPLAHLSQAVSPPHYRSPPMSDR